ncbi:MAG: hypothetical protein JST87_05625 [Bacteroidetes bacterium]|nr:hypothetical protein [Bacteroidota bacterium]
MFFKIFSFEVGNRFRRPAIYLYFLAVLIFTAGSFATGSLPVGEKEHINSPILIAFWCAAITLMMMLVSSSVMGTALFRDIEYNTKDYYLTYPITKAGYFWGRYFGAFTAMLFIASAILIGIYTGTKLGPMMGWRLAEQYGPNNPIYYLHAFAFIALPNIFFAASLFFGLVAVTRNIKVIYFGGIILFLFYFISIFFFNHTNNVTVITIADPFGVNYVRMTSNNSNSIQQNTQLIPVSGAFLINRILWTGLGLIILLATYFRFSFEKFFSGKRDHAAIDEQSPKTTAVLRPPTISFEKPYSRKTLINLTKIELLNILRDNYFRLIVLIGGLFLGFVFWLGNRNYGVEDYPRTVILLAIFNDVFPFFIFFILMFYTGETLHRDRATRYAFINDALPPANWVMNGSKLITLLFLAAGLSFIPFAVGITVQLLKGYYNVNLHAYATYIFLMLLPRLLEMVVFCYVLHVLIHNKFVAHAVGVTIWVGIFFIRETGIFNYNLLLYSYTPNVGISDMDGIGHMATPIAWFNIYWTLFAAILIIIAALFYYRGVGLSFKERIKLTAERFDKKTRLFLFALLFLFLPAAGYIYYNVSYLNNFLLKSENEERAILYERTLKHYDSLPLPKIIAAKMSIDIYPEEKKEFTKAFITVVNTTTKNISQILFDGDELSDFSIKNNGENVPYTSPLVYHRGLFNWFRPEKDTAAFRLYTFTKPLLPGDTTVLEINSSVVHLGFANDMYANNLLNNGTFFNGGMPGFGYDDDDEINSPYVRKKNNLPEKKEEDIKQDDPAGIATLKAGNVANLATTDVTISTSAEQVAIAPGKLVNHWKSNGRNFYHYVQDNPGLYPPFGIISAALEETKDSIQLGHQVNIDIFHLKKHSANLARYIEAYKNGLDYCSKQFGPYPYDKISLIETSIYGPWEASMPTMDTYSENNSWNAHFTGPDQFDFVYFNTSRLLAQQWWRFQVAPNNTVGSLVIPEGLSNYTALMLAEKKYGEANIRGAILNQLWFYLFVRYRMEEKEHPLLYANEWFEWGGKASVALYGLKCLIGEDSLNNALREFKNKYAFKNQPPYPGANNLLDCLEEHVPDSLKYFLDDTWKKITFYNNSINSVHVEPTANKNEFKVAIDFSIDKIWVNDKKDEIDATNMNDYIDIGIFGEQTKDATGRLQSNPLYLHQYQFKHGQHKLSIIVKGKPISAGVDPYSKLIDRNPNDNLKSIE